MLIGYCYKQAMFGSWRTTGLTIWVVITELSLLITHEPQALAYAVQIWSTLNAVGSCFESA